MTDNAPRSRRRAPASAQEQIDTRAVEIAAAAQSRIEGHEDLCAERFKNLADKVTQVASVQRENHEDNQGWMRRLETKVDGIGANQTIDAGKREGARLLGLTIKDWVIVAVALASVIFNFTHPHP